MSSRLSYVGRIVRFIMLVMLLIGSLSVGCGTDESGRSVVEQAITVRLSSKYVLSLTTIAGDCSLGPFMASGKTAIAEVRQANADISWDIYAVDERGEKSGLPIRLTGRICDDEGLAVLRMRGSQVARIESEGTACRSALWFPAAAAECAESADVCNDPGAFELRHDDCSGRIFGAFRSCYTFQESCFGQPPCRLGFQWDATPVGLDEDTAGCDPIQIPRPGDGCADECTRCGCGD